MSPITDVVNVFYSSTDEQVRTFDRKVVFDETCSMVGKAKSVAIKIWYWKDIAGGIAKTSGQEVIDSRVNSNYDVYFGFLGIKYGVGTVHEYEKAIEGHIARSMPKQIYFGFDDTPINPFQTDLSSVSDVKKFREDIASPARFGCAILYFHFATKEEYVDRVFVNLCAAVEEIQARVVGGIRIP